MGYSERRAPIRMQMTCDPVSIRRYWMAGPPVCSGLNTACEGPSTLASSQILGSPKWLRRKWSILAKDSPVTSSTKPYLSGLYSHCASMAKTAASEDNAAPCSTSTFDRKGQRSPDPGRSAVQPANTVINRMTTSLFISFSLIYSHFEFRLRAADAKHLWSVPPLVVRRGPRRNVLVL